MDEALREKRIVRLRADMTEENPEAAALLEELGNAAQSIPFVAVYSWTEPDNPITLADVFTRETLLRVLDEVAPSRSVSSSVAQAKTDIVNAGDNSPTSMEADSPSGETAAPTNETTEKHKPEKDDLWQPFSLEQVKVLRSRGVPLVVDWTADW